MHLFTTRSVVYSYTQLQDKNDSGSTSTARSHDVVTTAEAASPAEMRHCRHRRQQRSTVFTKLLILIMILMGDVCSAFLLPPSLLNRQRGPAGPMIARDSHGNLNQDTERRQRSPSRPQFRNKQQTANTRKTQLRWIFQSLEKMQLNGTLNNVAFPNTSSSSSSSSSVSSGGNGNHPHETPAAEKLVSSMRMLAHATTTAEVTAAGRQIRAVVERSQLLNFSTTTNYTKDCRLRHQEARIMVLERIIKATAMTGLHTLAWNITESLLLSSSLQEQQSSYHHYMPSTMVQEALCSSWRRAGKVQHLQDFFGTYLTRIVASRYAHEISLCSHNNRTTNTNSVVSTTAFNTFLAALCEPPPNHHQLAQQHHHHSKKKMAMMMMMMIPPKRLEQAIDWLLIRAPQDLHMAPDDVAYATLLQAASNLQNRTLSDKVWNAMNSTTAPKNIVAYNARLKLLLSSSSSSSSSSDEPILYFWDTVLLKDSNIQPDRYTIDLMILPLVRAGRIGQIEDLLDDFFANHSEQVIADAMAAFLITLTRGGEVASARALFETYLAPSLAPVLTAQVGSMIRLVKPTARHFNVLLAGYRQEAKRTSGKTNSTDAAIVAEAWDLFETMHHSSTTARPDSYTITTMMGLCRLSKEVASLIAMSLEEFNISCSGVVCNAAITAFGELGDPSSACWAFAFFREKDKWNLRSLNVLIGALGAALEAGSFDKVDVFASVAAKTLTSFGDCLDQCSIIQLIDGKTCVQGVRDLLDAMQTNQILDQQPLPLPSSQTYCIVATALQYGEMRASQALKMFRNATSMGVPADGRFVNAVLRCFGDDIDSALLAWKNEIRRACLAFENRPRNKPLSRKRIKCKNLVAAYHGLLHVCGRADRPDIAVRLVYAMNKEGIEPTELSLNCYRSGKRLRESITKQTPLSIVQKLRLTGSFESLLYVECMKYDRNDKRRSKERRVRIIV